MTWRERAACAGLTGLFFPTGNDANAAKRICRRCPVITECAKAGLREEHGVWAGRGEAERLGIARPRGGRWTGCRDCGVMVAAMRAQQVVLCEACRKAARRATYAASYQRRRAS